MNWRCPCSLGEEVGGSQETLGLGECLEESVLWEARYSALAYEVGQDQSLEVELLWRLCEVIRFEF